MEKITRKLVLREDLLAITGSDMYAAMILHQMIYWSARLRDVDRFLEEEIKRMENEGMEPTIQPQNGWIYKSARQLAEEEFMGITSTKTIERRFSMLTEKGYLTSRRNPTYKWDNTRQYRVDFPRIVRDIVKAGFPFPNDLPFDITEDFARLILKEIDRERGENKERQSDHSIQSDSPYRGDLESLQSDPVTKQSDLESERYQRIKTEKITKKDDDDKEKGQTTDKGGKKLSQTVQTFVTLANDMNLPKKEIQATVVRLQDWDVFHPSIIVQALTISYREYIRGNISSFPDYFLTVLEQKEEVARLQAEEQTRRDEESATREIESPPPLYNWLES